MRCGWRFWIFAELVDVLLQRYRVDCGKCQKSQGTTAFVVSLNQAVCRSSVQRRQAMKVLVGVKRVVDYAVKVRVNKGTVDLANIKQSMNPFCEVSLSRLQTCAIEIGTPFSP
jgi:hypothetical protein